jgi:hypothetical protein
MFSTPDVIENRRSKIADKGSNMKKRCCSILYALSSTLALTTGCLKETKPVALVSRPPLIVDEAMQQRPWGRTVVRFQNGETPAGPTGFLLAHPAYTPKLLPAVTDTPMFLENVFLMPVDYAINPPWRRMIYPAGVVEPSYTGIPPVPPKN